MSASRSTSGKSGKHNGMLNSKPNGMPCSSQSSFKAVGTSVNKVAVEATVSMATQEIGKAVKYAVW